MARSVGWVRWPLVFFLLLTGMGACGGAGTGPSLLPRSYDLLGHFSEAVVEAADPEYVHAGEIVFAGGEGRFALFEHADARIIFPEVAVYGAPRLEFGIAIHQDAWRGPGDGVRFVVEVIDETGRSHMVYERQLDPVHRPEDQGWFDETVDLGRFADQQLQVVLRTEAGSSNQNDWAAWSAPRILSWETPTDAAAEQPNILLITIDTLRGDHVSSYGYPRRTTPTLDLLAEQGVRFEQAYSHCEHTNPSHLTILTGLVPRSHGILNNYSPVPADIVTIPERLQEQGYHTVGVVSAYHLGPELGMDQGFTDFFPCGQERRFGEVTTEIATGWLEEHGNEPFFMWVHLFDPHSPYLPPYPYDVLYQPSSAPYTLPAAEVHQPDNWTERYGDWPPAFADIAEVIDSYDGAVTYADAQVARLLDSLDRQGLTDRTIVIVTSDHGEGFGEHGVSFDHYGLHREMIHVPLILRYPGRLPAGMVLSHPVGHVDLGPTLWELLGLAIPDEMQGTSLVGLMEGRRWDGPAAIVAQQHDDMSTAVRTEEWGLILQRVDDDRWPDYPLQAGAAELHDLRSDPGEERNLSPPPTSAAEEAQRELSRHLLDWESRTPVASWGALAPLDQQTEEMLRRLGY